MSELSDALRKLRDDGYAVEAIEDLLAGALLAQPPDARTALDDDTAELLGRFLLRAGVEAEDAPEGAARRVEAYLAAHPPDGALARRLADLLVEHVQRSAVVAKQAGARLLGTERDAAEGVLGGPRPPGTIAAGPLAAALARTLVDKEGKP